MRWTASRNNKFSFKSYFSFLSGAGGSLFLGRLSGNQMFPAELPFLHGRLVMKPFLQGITYTIEGKFM